MGVKRSSTFRRRIFYNFVLLFVIGIFILFIKRNLTVSYKHHNENGSVSKNSGSNRLGELKQVRILPVGGSDVIFDQPWSITEVKVHKSVENAVNINKTQRYIVSTMSYSHGLGNQMFEYAALQYYAMKHGAILLFPSDCLLRRAFKALQYVEYVEADELYDYVERNSESHIEAKACCSYLPDLPLPDRVSIVDGYFQSYRYFWPSFDGEIRKSFQFLNGVRERAVNVIKTYSNGRTTVGVHVRHGVDITWHSRNLQHGHLSAPVDYYQRAFSTIEEQYGQVVYLVVSDNISWAKRNLPDGNRTLYFIENTDREVDLAILSYCNHTIISTGTFSWWGAYLANGTTLYYKDWPKKGSQLEKMVDKRSYFIPTWKEL